MVADCEKQEKMNEMFHTLQQQNQALQQKASELLTFATKKLDLPPAPEILQIHQQNMSSRDPGHLALEKQDGYSSGQIKNLLLPNRQDELSTILVNSKQSQQHNSRSNAVGMFDQTYQGSSKETGSKESQQQVPKVRASVPTLNTKKQSPVKPKKREDDKENCLHIAPPPQPAAPVAQVLQQKNVVDNTSKQEPKRAEEDPQNDTMCFSNNNTLDDYIIGKQIGQGAYAVVRIGLHKPTNRKVALKIYKKYKLEEPNRRKSVKREIKLMEKMKNS